LDNQTRFAELTCAHRPDARHALSKIVKRGKRPFATSSHDALGHGWANTAHLL
jgi:hypothetical protein